MKRRPAPSPRDGSPGQRPRRVLLFCPADEPRKVEKAARLPVDGVILDLEDGVAPGRKDAARESALVCLEKVDFGRREVIVRINPVGTSAGRRDLQALAGARRRPDSCLLPKVESAAEVRRAAVALAPTRDRRRPPALLALLESSRGIVRLESIAAAHPRLEALVFGAEDLCGDVGGVRTPEGREILYARSAVALHGAAAGLQTIDTPYVDLQNAEGLRVETREALALGYTGKLAIHPSQVDPILEILTPSAEAIVAARRLVEEYDHHVAAGRGVFVLDGKMVDHPMLRAAEAVLARARRSGVPSIDDPS